MGKGHISLNGVEYMLRPRSVMGQQVLIEEYAVPSFIPRYTQGQSDQDARTEVGSRTFGPLTGGFGRDRITSQETRSDAEYRRFYDATCDTRWPITYLPLNQATATSTGLEVLRASAAFKGDIWAIWEDDSSRDIVARDFTGSSTTWGGGGNVDVGGSDVKVGLDLLAHKTHLISLHAEEDDHEIMRSTDGASWSAASTQLTAALLTNNVTANENIDAGLLADIGGEVIAAVWHESAGTITFFSSSNAGDDWTDESIDIGSGNGPQGLAVMVGTDNEDKLLLGTREGLYEIDTAPSTWTFRMIYPMPPHNSNCKRMTVHNGALWFAQGVDNDSPAPIYRMEVMGSERRFEAGLGLNVGDGVPSDLLGPVRWMKSVNDFLFITIGGGAASRHARVLCHNGEGWHSIWKDSSADRESQWLDFSADDDGTPRLHWGIRTGSATMVAAYINHATTNPQSGVSIVRTESGIIDLPYTDGGFPTTNGTWVKTAVNASSLSADTDGEYIAISFGVNSSSRTGTSLGSIVNGTTALNFGSSGEGKEGFNIGLRITLNRDSSTTTDTPGLRELQIDFVKPTDYREGFRFVIDIDATAANNQTTVEQIISALKTARDLATLPAFSYGATGTLYVRLMPPMRFSQDVRSDNLSAPNTLAQRGGICEVVVEEVR